jgi:hypothetical protein
MPHPSENSKPISAVSASSDIDKIRLEFLWKVHGYTNDYIRFADTKAGFVAGIVSAIIGALVASHPFDSLAGMPLGQQHYRVWFSFLALLVLVFSFTCAVLSIKPRLKAGSVRGVIYWGSVIQHRSDLAYANECRKLGSDEMESNVSLHIYSLAVISSRKYFWTNLSILAGAFGALLSGVIILSIHITFPTK